MMCLQINLSTTLKLGQLGGDLSSHKWSINRRSQATCTLCLSRPYMMRGEGQSQCPSLQHSTAPLPLPLPLPLYYPCDTCGSG